MTAKKSRGRSRDESGGVDEESSLEPMERDQKGRRRGKHKKRVDTLTAERRTEWVRKAIIQGFGTSDILAAINKDPKWGGISRRQSFRYIAKALGEVRAASTRERSLELGKAIERNEMIIRKSLSPPEGGEVDLRTAVRANQANARLMGLEAPTRHAHGQDPDLPPIEAGGDFIVLVQEVAEG